MNKLLQNQIRNSGSNIVLKPLLIYVLPVHSHILQKHNRRETTETMPNGLVFTPNNEDSTLGN
jgi:hypothetical protein